MVAGFVMKLVPPRLVCGCAPISEGYRLCGVCAGQLPLEVYIYPHVEGRRIRLRGCAGPTCRRRGFYAGFDRATYILVHKVILEYLVLFAILAYLLALLPPLLCTLGLP